MIERFLWTTFFYFFLTFRLFSQDHFLVTNLESGEDVTLAAHFPIMVPINSSVTFSATDKSQAVHFEPSSEQEQCYVEVALFAKDQNRVLYYKLKKDDVSKIYLLSSDTPIVVMAKLKNKQNEQVCAALGDKPILAVTSNRPMQVKR